MTQSTILTMANGKSAQKNPPPKDNAEWVNPISGQLYRWDSQKRRWVPAGEYPYGTNPMGILGDWAP